MGQRFTPRWAALGAMWAVVCGTPGLAAAQASAASIAPHATRTALVSGPAQVSPVSREEAGTIAWADSLTQADAWYGTAEAIRIADVVLLHQRTNGGWAKNVDMARRLDAAERRQLAREQAWTDTTIDNGATVTQIRYLARMLAAADREDGARGRDRSADLPHVRRGLERGIERGVAFLLAAQYANGGWPQYFPLRANYSRYITYNDNAMIGVMQLLRDVAAGGPPYAFLTAARRREAADAIARGLRVVLASQIRLNDMLTVWCAQHDDIDFRPRPARSYELASLSGSESVGIVRYLMSLDAPDIAVIRAVEGAVNWFRRSRIRGVRIERRQAPSLPRGFDLVAVRDRSAPPLWGRFYDLEENQPFFCNRDGRVVHTLAELEYERRTGYSWMGPYATDLLAREYPRWRQRVAARVP